MSPTTPSQFRERYDWVTFGDHPAAILSAAMVARLGLSAIIVPLEKPMAPLKGEQVLDLEPSWLDGLGRIGAAPGLWRSALERLLGKSGADGFWERVSEPPFSREIVTPHDRIGVARDAVAWSLEFAREWAADGQVWADAVQRADRATARFWERWFEAFQIRIENGKRIATRAPRVDECIADEARGASGPVRTLLRSRRSAAEMMAAAYAVAQRERALGLERAFDLPDAWLGSAFERSGASFRGGMQSFRQALLQIATDCGAQVASGEVCARIDVEAPRSPKLRSFMLSGLPSPILASAGAFSGSYEQLVECLRETAPGSVPGLTRSEPVAWRFTLGFTLHREAIPAQIPSRLTILDLEGPPIEVEWAEAEAYGVDEPEHVVLFARTPVDFAPETLAVEWQRRLAARMMRKLTQVIPFIEFHVARVSPDFRSPHDPANDEFSSGYGFAALEMIPERLRIYPRTTHKRDGGIRTGIDGLFRVGPWSYPDWGSSGALRAAIESVAWLAHKSGKPGPFLA